MCMLLRLLGYSQAVVQVDEEGTEAAAVTAIGLGSAPPVPALPLVRHSQGRDTAYAGLQWDCAFDSQQATAGHVHSGISNQLTVHVCPCVTSTEQHQPVPIQLVCVPCHCWAAGVPLARPVPLGRGHHADDALSRSCDTPQGQLSLSGVSLATRCFR